MEKVAKLGWGNRGYGRREYGEGEITLKTFPEILMETYYCRNTHTHTQLKWCYPILIGQQDPY